jgi:hypothetical protein
MTVRTWPFDGSVAQPTSNGVSPVLQVGLHLVALCAAKATRSTPGGAYHLRRGIELQTFAPTPSCHRRFPWPKAPDRDTPLPIPYSNDASRGRGFSLSFRRLRVHQLIGASATATLGGLQVPPRSRASRRRPLTATKGGRDRCHIRSCARDGGYKTDH